VRYRFSIMLWAVFLGAAGAGDEERSTLASLEPRRRDGGPGDASEDCGESVEESELVDLRLRPRLRRRLSVGLREALARRGAVAPTSGSGEDRGECFISGDVAVSRWDGAWKNGWASLMPSRPNVTSSKTRLVKSRGLMAGLREKLLGGSIEVGIGLAIGSVLRKANASSGSGEASSLSQSIQSVGRAYELAKTGEVGEPGDGAESVVKSVPKSSSGL